MCNFLSFKFPPLSCLELFEKCFVLVFVVSTPLENRPLLCFSGFYVIFKFVFTKLNVLGIWRKIVFFVNFCEYCLLINCLFCAYTLFKHFLLVYTLFIDAANMIFILPVNNYSSFINYVIDMENVYGI